MLEVLKSWKQTTQSRAANDWVFASPARIGRLPWSVDSLNHAYLIAGKAPGVGQVSTQLSGVFWRKRVRVERTIDIEDANRRF
jgi:hypothetical protein